jgi:hypothetical protein
LNRNFDFHKPCEIFLRACPQWCRLPYEQQQNYLASEDDDKKVDTELAQQADSVRLA